MLSTIPVGSLIAVGDNAPDFHKIFGEHFYPRVLVECDTDARTIKRLSFHFCFEREHERLWSEKLNKDFILHF